MFSRVLMGFHGAIAFVVHTQKPSVNWRPNITGRRVAIPQGTRSKPLDHLRLFKKCCWEASKYFEHPKITQRAQAFENFTMPCFELLNGSLVKQIFEWC